MILPNTVRFLLACGLIFTVHTNIKRRKNFISEINRIRDEQPLKTIPPSCAFDARVLCDPTVHPLQTLLDEDPFVRMVLVSPVETLSPEFSTEILDSLFAEPSNTGQLTPSTYDQEDAVIGAMLEEMMSSAMRLSVAAEEMTSPMYYGTTESATEETFVAMLTSLMNHSRESSGAVEYYHDPSQLRDKLCQKGKKLLKTESEKTGSMVEYYDATRLKLARRLSEVQTDPESTDGNVILINGIESPMMFITSFRMIINEDSTDIAPPMAGPFPNDGAVQNCLWSAYTNMQFVSQSCSRALDEFQMSKSKDAILLKHNLSVNNNYPVIIWLLIFLSLRVLYGNSDEERNDEDSLGNEYHEIGESIKRNGAYIAVPLRVV